MLCYSMMQSATTWLHANKVIANKLQKICDKFQKMLCIPSMQTKPPAKNTFNVNDTKFTIHQTLI